MAALTALSRRHSLIHGYDSVRCHSDVRGRGAACTGRRGRDCGRRGCEGIVPITSATAASTSPSAPPAAKSARSPSTPGPRTCGPRGVRVVRHRRVLLGRPAGGDVRPGPAHPSHRQAPRTGRVDHRAPADAPRPLLPGCIEYNDEEIKGRHELLIDEDLFDRAKTSSPPRTAGNATEPFTAPHNANRTLP